MLLKICALILFTLKLTALFHLIATQGCKTPLGSKGTEMDILNCEPIIWLLRHYGRDMPPTERLFIKHSLLPGAESQNQTMICCDQNMNVSRVFQSVGAEILRISASLCRDHLFKRISFGAEATFMMHPWSVLLVYDTPQRFHCGGTLITNRYVLTAAHCVANDYLTLIGVRLREHNTSSAIDCALDIVGNEHCYEPAMDVNIEEIVKHKHFSRRTFDNDIALLRLANFVEYESHSIGPICIPTVQDQLFDQTNGRIYGWGSTEKSQYSAVLLEAEIPIHALDYCQQIYRRSKIDDKRICGAGENAIETCKGDSGGPLILYLENYMKSKRWRYMQIGLISAGAAGCGDPRNLPTVFLRLSAYIAWIADNIEI